VPPRPPDRYRQLFEQNTAVQLLADPVNGAIVDANQAAADFYGLGREELARRRLTDLTADPAAFTADEFEIASVVGAHLTAFPQRHASGETRLVDLYAGPLALEDRVLVHIIVHDVTERERAAERERALIAERVAREFMERAAEEWRRTFDAIDLPILVVDASDCLTQVNAAARELDDGSLGVAAGTRIAAEVPSRLWRVIRERVHLARELGQAGPSRVLDGRGRTWEVWASRFTPSADAGARLIVVARELTALIDLQEEVQRKETMARMGELVAGVAHEVRNPLFALSSTLDAMRARFGDTAPPEFARYYPVLSAQVQRLSDLTRDLLEYGRPSQMTLEPCGVDDLLRLTNDLTRTVAETHGVRVAVTSAPSRGRVRADRARLLQVLHNLVLNAIQFSAAGGIVTLQAARVDTGPHPYWLFIVRDQGPGFPRDALPHVFEPFFTKRPGGTGLGLALAYRIVADHGGTITAGNAAPGPGATVQFTLPLLAEADSS
jgi:PAS domain S-box-containing protein